MMAGYRFNKEEYFKETKAVYSNYPTDVSRMEKNWIAFRKKIQRQVLFRKNMDLQNSSQDAEVILFHPVRFMQKLIQEESRIVLLHHFHCSQA